MLKLGKIKREDEDLKCNSTLISSNLTNSLPKSTHSFSPNNVLYFISIIPVIVITYLQLAYNLFLIYTISTSIFNFSKILRYDIQKYVDNKQHNLFLQVFECTKEYIDNGCTNEVIPPIIQNYCTKWKQCMDTDVTYILTSKETAQVFADILNNFFENLSTRTVFSVIVILTSLTLILNIILYWSRLKYKLT